MGVILDSSVLIAAERQGQNARQMLSAVVRKTGNTEVALSVITLLELAHGAARAETLDRKLKPEQFIHDLSGDHNDCPARGPDRRREPIQRDSPFRLPIC